MDPDTDYSGIARLFSVMAGKEITADMFADGTYLEQVKDISAAMWIDESSVLSVHMAPGTKRRPSAPPNGWTAL